MKGGGATTGAVSIFDFRNTNLPFSCLLANPLSSKKGTLKFSVFHSPVFTMIILGGPLFFCLPDKVRARALTLPE